MDSVRRYVQRAKLPHGVYSDKHTTDRSQAEPRRAEQLAGETPQSQFARALTELDVNLIHAHSPQAKGRVKRLFKTLRDRLVKDLRLAGLATIEAANWSLAAWRPLDNRRFTVQPAQADDLHRPRPAGRALDRRPCIKTTRCLRKDFTIAHQGGLYQIHDTVRTSHVLVEERVDGTMRMMHQGRILGVHAITSRPMKAAEAKKVHRPRGPVTPRPDHPWRTRLLPTRETHAAAATT